METILVVDNAANWNLEISGVRIVESSDYLIDLEFQKKTYKVFNLCKSYSYQSSGYYVSLLASARHHKVIPSISTILDMKSRELLKIRSSDLDDLIQTSLKDIKSDEFVLSVYFGRNLARKYDKLVFELHKHFHAPLIRAKFKKKNKWTLTSVSPISLKDVPFSHLGLLRLFATHYFQKRLINSKTEHARFSLAILVDPNEKFPPTDAKGLKWFMEAAEKKDIDSELITKHDFHRLAEFDGLFIRETTAVNHHTYKFAQKAEALGLTVIDDPVSILRCTNKVYLAELFSQHKIPTPKTTLVHKDNLQALLPTLPIPAVLKQPDSAFSQGVCKAETKAELKEKIQNLLEASDIIVVQEFVPTTFDWRVGVINHKPLYVCKYHMARNHWQIYKQGNSGVENGTADTYALGDVSPALIELAVKSTKWIGNGLYGVDIKESKGKFYVIEVNDNPSIESYVEDKILKKALYDEIMQVFLERMKSRVNG